MAAGVHSRGDGIPPERLFERRRCGARRARDRVDGKPGDAGVDGGNLPHQCLTTLVAVPARPGTTWVPQVDGDSGLLRRLGPRVELSPQRAPVMVRPTLPGRGTPGRLAPGDMERSLAKQYHDWAQKVSGRWPLAGAVLEGLISTYEEDASQVDRRAEWAARGDA